MNIGNVCGLFVIFMIVVNRFVEKRGIIEKKHYLIVAIQNIYLQLFSIDCTLNKSITTISELLWGERLYDLR